VTEIRRITRIERIGECVLVTEDLT